MPTSTRSTTENPENTPASEKGAIVSYLRACQSRSRNNNVPPTTTNRSTLVSPEDLERIISDIKQEKYKDG